MLHHAAPLPTRWYLYPFRRTKQSVLQVLDSGLCPRENHVGELCRLLDSPCLQGVGEGSTPGGALFSWRRRLEWKARTSTTPRALGEEVATCSKVYYWPKKKSARTRVGKPVSCTLTQAESCGEIQSWKQGRKKKQVVLSLFVQGSTVFLF